MPSGAAGQGTCRGLTLSGIEGTASEGWKSGRNEPAWRDDHGALQPGERENFLRDCVFPGSLMTDRLCFTMANTLDELARLIGQINGALETRNIPPRAAYRVNLVLEEVLTNIIKYAYQPGSRHAIEVSMELKEDDVVLECIDDGKPFDPLSLPPPDLERSLEELEPGGLGIHLVRQTAQEIRYCYQEGKNVLRICIKLGQREKG
jgi:serine/threonine-protein kinase RsbW